MSSQEHRAQSILAVDFGAATTRANLFDTVEGVYRHVATGEAPSTFGAPYHDVLEGLRHALEDIQAVTGRRLYSDQTPIITPIDNEGHGVDLVTATSSGGPALRAILVGLLPQFSLAADARATEGAHLQIVETLSLTDGRTTQQQLDAVYRARPELIVFAGGKDGGANESIVRLTETIGLACYRLGGANRQVVYAGNAALSDKVSTLLASIADVHVAPNVQPTLGTITTLSAGQELARATIAARAGSIGGLREMAAYSQGRLLPTAQAAGVLLQFMSKGTTPWRRILYADVGSQSTAVISAIDGKLTVRVDPDLGVGLSSAATLRSEGFDSFARWLPGEPAEDAIRDFIETKSRVAPHTVPVNADDLYAEAALARAALRGSLRRAHGFGNRHDLIIGGGATMANAPHPGLAALVLLDGLSPIGLTTLMVDRNHLVPTLGATAYFNPLAPVQVLENGGLLTLGTALSLTTSGRGTSALAQGKLTDESGAVIDFDIAPGTIKTVPLAANRTAKLTLKPRRDVDAGAGPGRPLNVKVLGGTLGLVLDGRGRPSQPPRDAAERAEVLQTWWNAMTEVAA
jgi:hypothetical protein